MNRNTGEIKEQTVFMGDFPMMTEKGTFIINGTERVVVSQLVRCPGVIFEPGERFRLRNLSKHQLVKGTIHPYRGEWLEFDVEQKPGKDVTAGTRVARKRRMGIFTLLRTLGYDEERAPGSSSGSSATSTSSRASGRRSATLAPTQNEALVADYKRARPGEPPTVESAKAYFRNAFFENRRYDLSRVGRYKLDRKLGDEIGKLDALFGKGTRDIGSFFQADNDDPNNRGVSSDPDDDHVLRPNEVLAAVSYMLHLVKQEPGYRLDDQDHFANRRIRSVGELIQNQVRIGLSRMEHVVRERMTTQDVEAITPTTLVNIRPVVAAVKEFFGTSQLSQFMDQVNPLSGLTHRRRLSALGPGGLSPRPRRLRSPRRALQPLRPHVPHRDAGRSEHRPHRCALHLRPREPLRVHRDPVPRGQERQGHRRDPLHGCRRGRELRRRPGEHAHQRRRHLQGRPSARASQPAGRQPGRPPQDAGSRELLRATTDIASVPPEEVQLMDVSPKQIVSVATALIPFLEHDDANHALMGANMQRQAVPLVHAEAPYIGTGIEDRAAHDTADLIQSTGEGEVLEVSGASIVVNYKEGGKRVYPLSKFRRSNQDTCINHRARVKEGDKIVKGTILADGPSTDHGELALGKNLLVALMPWEGYNFEDAIILSERLVKDDVLTSIHIHEHEVDARRHQARAGRDLPRHPEPQRRHPPRPRRPWHHPRRRRGGPRRRAGGQGHPQGRDRAHSPKSACCRAIFGEKAREVRDTSLKVPHGESGKVIDVKVFTREDGHELPPGVNQLVRVYVAQKRKISVGDKLAGRHGNKGVISKILPIEDMPYTADGSPVDIILNPLGVPSRMNVGQVLEAHLGYAARWGWTDAKNNKQVGDAPIRGTETKTRPTTKPSTFVATPVFDGAHWDEDNAAGKHPTIQSIFEHLNPESVDGVRLIQTDGKTTLYNGRTGLAYDNPVTIGYMYILKLAHLVDDKIHARSTGPYSMITQQPLGGKAQFGGQRFGEMEVWALEAYGAAYCLQELLTIKSDDVLGRVKVYEAIVKGENSPSPAFPRASRCS